MEEFKDRMRIVSAANVEVGDTLVNLGRVEAVSRLGDGTRGLAVVVQFVGRKYLVATGGIRHQPDEVVMHATDEVAVLRG